MFGEEIGIVGIPEDNLFAKQSVATAVDRFEGCTLDTNNSCNFDERQAMMPENPLSLLRGSSILKNSQTYQPRARSDSRGQTIAKFGKEHSITFSEQLLEVHEVENWKEYNIIEDEEEVAQEKCNCWII